MTWAEAFSMPLVVSTFLVSILAMVAWATGSRYYFRQKKAALKAIEDNNNLEMYADDWLANLESNKELGITWYAFKVQAARQKKTELTVHMVFFLVAPMVAIAALVFVTSQLQLVARWPLSNTIRDFIASAMFGGSTYAVVKLLTFIERLDKSITTAERVFDKFAGAKLKEPLPLPI